VSSRDLTARSNRCFVSFLAVFLMRRVFFGLGFLYRFRVLFSCSKESSLGRATEVSSPFFR
jgi:hypothetical protein